ncbi:hyaluronoglucosaminidase [Dictyocaulus viviparus]|uniref:Hyaluronidase n=1 Tax=Dictyocaulus viviparus TaxID=29172 RepID=A0A0D8Y377_DICVI|nr:hyaluronoglucosaminidase [Dictyocaulus viviparus]
MIFYEHRFGIYPYFKNYNQSEPINGGLPQKVNLSAHLDEVKKNITDLIPDENFSGFAVIDIEEWRPLFEQHRGNAKMVYINASIGLVKEEHPEYNETKALEQAEIDFTEAANPISAVPSNNRPISVLMAYWNVPSEICWKKLHMNLSLQEYDIIANENYSLNGDEVVIFYEHKFGLYPYFKDYNLSQPINGGLPQNCNIDNHLKELEKNITTLIPNVNFSGLAVIDIEEWRPLFEQHRGNVKVNCNILITLKSEKHRKPDLNETEAEKLAEAEFNKAAKEFIVKTMELAKSMRPKARWGLYGFPYCNYDAGTKDDNYNCSNKYKGFNDKMQYIYNQSTALYPSIYYGFNASAERRYRYAILNETQRVAKNFSRSLPIFVYSKFEYHPRKELESFYNESDQCSTIKQSTDMGADGLIFWSSSANMEKRCDFISQFINSSLGLYVLRMKTFPKFQPSVSHVN